MTIDYSDVSIGQYADYFHYDPDGIAGLPTPQNDALEDQLFGRSLMKIYREKKHTPVSDSSPAGNETTPE